MRSWFREWCLNLSCWVCLERHTACSGVSHQIKCLRRWQSCQGPRCPLRSLRVCRWILTEKELLRFVGTKPTSSWKPNKFVNWTEVSAVQWARVIFSITTSWMNELHLCDSCDWICSMSMKYDIHDLQKGALQCLVTQWCSSEAAFGEHRRASAHRASDHLWGAFLKSGYPSSKMGPY